MDEVIWKSFFSELYDSDDFAHVNLIKENKSIHCVASRVRGGN